MVEQKEFIIKVNSLQVVGHFEERNDEQVFVMLTIYGYHPNNERLFHRKPFFKQYLLNITEDVFLKEIKQEILYLLYREPDGYIPEEIRDAS